SGIIQRGRAQLLEIIHAACPAARFARRGNRRQEERDEYADDRNDDQELHQGETIAPPTANSAKPRLSGQSFARHDYFPILPKAGPSKTLCPHATAKISQLFAHPRLAGPRRPRTWIFLLCSLLEVPESPDQAPGKCVSKRKIRDQCFCRLLRSTWDRY